MASAKWVNGGSGLGGFLFLQVCLQYPLFCSRNVFLDMRAPSPSLPTYEEGSLSPALQALELCAHQYSDLLGAGTTRLNTPGLKVQWVKILMLSSPGITCECPLPSRRHGPSTLCVGWAGLARLERQCTCARRHATSFHQKITAGSVQPVDSHWLRANHRAPCCCEEAEESGQISLLWILHCQGWKTLTQKAVRSPGRRQQALHEYDYAPCRQRASGQQLSLPTFLLPLLGCQERADNASETLVSTWHRVSFP